MYGADAGMTIVKSGCTCKQDSLSEHIHVHVSASDNTYNGCVLVLSNHCHSYITLCAVCNSWVIMWAKTYCLVPYCL